MSEQRPNYPGNSYSERRNKERREVQTVAQGRTVHRRKTLGEKLAGTFLKSNGKSVLDYIFNDELIPRLIDGFVASCKGALDILFYDDSRPASKSSARARGGTKRSYDRYYDEQNRRRERSERRSDRDDEPQDFASTVITEVAFDSKREAEAVVRELEEAMDEHEEGGVTVLEFYRAANIPTNRNYMLDKYGWTNFNDIVITRESDGWILKMPRPKRLD